MALKKNLKVFIGIPNLANDGYSNYIGSVKNYLMKQETTVKLMEPYVTPPHAGKFHLGQKDRLDAIAGRMNTIVDKFMTSDASHLFINDGDVEIPPNCIDTLLRHNVDIASGVYPFKNFEHSHAMVFGRMLPGSECGSMIPRTWEFMKGQVFGDKDMWVGGAGCMLIKRRVFKRYHPRIRPLRFTRDNDCSLDTYFWKRAQEAGFTARVDANIVCGHLPNYPLNKIDKWLNY